MLQPTNKTVWPGTSKVILRPDPLGQGTITLQRAFIVPKSCHNRGHSASNCIRHREVGHLGLVLRSLGKFGRNLVLRILPPGLKLPLLNQLTRTERPIRGRPRCRVSRLPQGFEVVPIINFFIFQGELFRFCLIGSCLSSLSRPNFLGCGLLDIVTRSRPSTIFLRLAFLPSFVPFIPWLPLRLPPMRLPSVLPT